MSILAENVKFDFRASSLYFTEHCICLELMDGREVRTPLEFYPRLKYASEKERNNFEIIGMGTGIHWPDIDEDLSVRGILLGHE